MISVLGCIRSVGRSLCKPLTSTLDSAASLPWRSSATTSRCMSYEAYPKFEDNPEPFKPKTKRRYGYNFKSYIGGVLPRPKGELEDKPLPGTKIDFSKRDQWTPKKAVFGQNDYIDILGDGTIHPYQLMQGPKWLRAFKGNELQRLVRRLKFEGKMLADLYPTKYLELRKQIFFLYKKLNRRRHAPYWSGNSPHRNSRFTRTKERFKY